MIKAKETVKFPGIGLVTLTARIPARMISGQERSRQLDPGTELAKAFCLGVGGNEVMKTGKAEGTAHFDVQDQGSMDWTLRTEMAAFLEIEANLDPVSLEGIPDAQLLDLIRSAIPGDMEGRERKSYLMEQGHHAAQHRDGPCEVIYDFPEGNIRAFKID